MIKYDLYLGADFIHISIVTLLSSGKLILFIFKIQTVFNNIYRYTRNKRDKFVLNKIILNFILCVSCKSQKEFVERVNANWYI